MRGAVVHDVKARFLEKSHWVLTMSNNEKIAAAVVVGILVLIPIVQGIWVDKVLTEGGESVATVEREGHKTLVVSYSVGQDSRQVTISRPYPGFMPREKYVVKYDKSSGYNAVVLFWRPIFNKKAFVKIKPESIAEALLIAGNVVMVEYTVKDLHVKRYMELPPGFDMDNLSHLSLLYDPRMPEVSYIDLSESTF